MANVGVADAIMNHIVPSKLSISQREFVLARQWVVARQRRLKTTATSLCIYLEKTVQICIYSWDFERLFDLLEKAGTSLRPMVIDLLWIFDSLGGLTIVWVRVSFVVSVANIPLIAKEHGISFLTATLRHGFMWAKRFRFSTLADQHLASLDKVRILRGVEDTI